MDEGNRYIDCSVEQLATIVAGLTREGLIFRVEPYGMELMRIFILGY